MGSIVFVVFEKLSQKCFVYEPIFVTTAEQKQKMFLHFFFDNMNNNAPRIALHSLIFFLSTLYHKLIHLVLFRTQSPKNLLSALRIGALCGTQVKFAYEYEQSLVIFT